VLPTFSALARGQKSPKNLFRLKRLKVSLVPVPALPLDLFKVKGLTPQEGQVTRMSARPGRRHCRVRLYRRRQVRE
jgi:hypothetical protein